MNQALEQARKASRKGEVPIGALVIQRNSDGTFQELSRACNLVETKQDASAHAELLALRQAAKRTKNWRLFNTTLYSTLEPCPMCLAAIQAFRVSSIVYGAPDLRLGAIETHIRLLDFPHPFHTIDSVVPGIQQNTSAELLRDFFRQRRQKTNATKKIPRRTWKGKIFQNRTWWK
jgi:tRNA(adenine34) deaminase